ncbi:MAG: glycosyl hydrolase family 28 protein [Bacilli bacterium]|nr:glycosyl hydrolase family 28 protein [Bacilli bacterium]
MIVFNVNKLGIIGDGKTLLTKALQSLIDRAPKGATIYFPKGRYVLSTIFLKSDLIIKLDKEAVILGSKRFNDYAKEEKVNYPLYQDASHSFFNCSLFVGKKLKNITITGGTIDMRSVWDDENIRDMVHRGPKCITLVECENIKLNHLKILNVTDLAVYLVMCRHVICDYLNLKVYIDGISPDNSKDVVIKNCNVISGDDGIVFKSSYNLNKLGKCEDIKVSNCMVTSRCNAIKFGTESNGAFLNISVKDTKIINSRITGISVESVDGAHIKNLTFNNIEMKNTGTPIFVHLGKRLRGPKGSKIGSISNITFNNIKATGPYKLVKTIAWNYDSYVRNNHYQYPGVTSLNKVREVGTWQVTSNICGLKGHNLKNITLKNIYFELDGGVKSFSNVVPLEPKEYPEVHTYGTLLPAYGIYFRHVNSPEVENVKIKLLHKDKRKCFIFDE